MPKFIKPTDSILNRPALNKAVLPNTPTNPVNTDTLMPKPLKIAKPPATVIKVAKALPL